MSELALSKQFWKVSVEEEYKSVDELKQSYVDAIKDWLKKQPHLPQIGENEIIIILRACNYSMERTKETIDFNFTFRTKSPEFFSQRDVTNQNILYAAQNIDIVVIPKRLDDMMVVIGRIKEIELSKFNEEDYVKLAFMIFDMIHLEYGSSAGFIYILDISGLTLSLFLRVSMQTISNLLKYLQYCATFQIKGLHIVNGGVIFDKVYPLIQQFIKPEINKMLNVHTDYESLRNVMDPNFLPSNYGGTCASIEELNKITLEKIKHLKDWYIAEESLRVNEKKRPSNSVSPDYGIQGSFKRLDFD